MAKGWSSSDGDDDEEDRQQDRHGRQTDRDGTLIEGRDEVGPGSREAAARLGDAGHQALHIGEPPLGEGSLGG